MNTSMKTNRTSVATNAGGRTTLSSNDTRILAFPRGETSIPSTLRAKVSEKSLKRIRDNPRWDGSSVQAKVKRALALRLQLSDHGCGRKSAQVFDGDRLVLDCNL